MTYRLIIRPEAESDIDAAYAWYEKQRPGLGREFPGEVGECFNLIEENPHLYASVRADIQRALTRRFPFGVFYVPGADTVSVVAVLHTVRHPRSWERRIDP